MTHPQVLVGLAVAVAVIASAVLARQSRVPAPVFLVLAGLAVGLVPGIAEIRLPPQVVFYVFLPPLLYSAAFFTAPREARENWGAILGLAVGLTALTLFAVGLVAWWLVAALGFGGAFVLGAVLGPTDPVSATAVIRGTTAPEQLQTILEGESLVNDGVGLVAFTIALSAAEHGSFSVADGILTFLRVSAGGIALGLAVGVLVAYVRTRVHSTEIELPLSLLTPYVAYIAADRAHLSGVLATVAVGVYLGWRQGGIFRPEVRLQSVAFWDVLTYLLSSVLFVLLGTQFRQVLAGLSGYSTWRLVRDAVLVFAVVTVVRFAWMFTVPQLIRRWRDVAPRRDRFVLGWSGMRGALSLAAALSIPISLHSREETLFLTFTTILAGLVLLGIPLPWLLERLGFGATALAEEEREARAAVTRAALARLEELGAEDWAPQGTLDALRGLYEGRLERLAAADGAADTDAYLRLRHELLAAERQELDRLEREGALAWSAARRIERQLDHEESGLRR